MLEPFVALGLASAVIEFVDFGSKIIIEGYGAYKSLEGSTGENLHIETITLHVKDLGDRLSSPQEPTAPASNDDAAIRKLAQRCTALAKDLLDILEDLKVKGSSFRSWEAFRKVLRSVRKADKIHQLETRLNDIKTQINSHLLNFIKEGQLTVLLSLQNLESASRRTEQETISRLEDTKKELINILEHQDKQSLLLRQIQQAQQASQHRSQDDTPNPGQKFQTSFHLLAEKIMRMSQDVLESLVFHEMPMRQFDIKPACSETFEWIFQPHSTPFACWLETDSGVFWVTGKPGSGKSTFMKFLCDHPRIKIMLRRWAGQSKLVIASHFFWSAGYPIQRAQEGLFRNLLHQILKQCPNLIPEVCPQRWTESVSYDGKDHPWTRQELLDTLIRLVNRKELNARFCFFIDGLDEYDGDHFRLIEEFERFTSHSFVKFCVSSRPWTVFKDAYGGIIGRELVVQDLTRGDMEIYIHGELTKDTRFQRMVKTEPEIQDLVRQISQKAQGVFLWVYLAVRSLLRGLSARDDICVLEQRLTELPSELKEYFQRMLDTVDDVYKAHAARAYLLAVHSREPLPLLIYGNIPPDRADPDYAVQMMMGPLSRAALDRLRSKAELHVNTWCRDLLEVSGNVEGITLGDPMLSHKVDFLHRTVKDFLFDRELQALLYTRAGSAFSAEMCLCRLWLVLGKFTIKLDSQDSSKSFLTSVEEIMYYANAYESETGQTVSELLLELDHIGSIYFEARHTTHWTPFQGLTSIKMDHCPRRLYGEGQVFDRSEAYTNRESNFLAYAVCCDLRVFVAHIISKASFEDTGGRAILHFALYPTLLPDTFLRHGARSDTMIDLLISKGFDINGKVSSTSKNTIWEEFLMHCQHGGGKAEFRTALLLLKRGADPHVKVWKSLNDFADEDAGGRCSGTRVSVAACLRACCPKDELSTLDEALRTAKADAVRPTSTNSEAVPVRPTLLSSVWKSIWG